MTEWLEIRLLAVKYWLQGDSWDFAKEYAAFYCGSISEGQMTAKKRNIIQTGIVAFLFASMLYVCPDSEPNALPVVKVKVSSGCNSCHEGVGK